MRAAADWIHISRSDCICNKLWVKAPSCRLAGVDTVTAASYRIRHRCVGLAAQILRGGWRTPPCRRPDPFLRAASEILLPVCLGRLIPLLSSPLGPELSLSPSWRRRRRRRGWRSDGASRRPPSWRTSRRTFDSPGSTSTLRSPSSKKGSPHPLPVPRAGEPVLIPGISACFACRSILQLVSEVRAWWHQGCLGPVACRKVVGILTGPVPEWVLRPPLLR
jgi:hypothetical protein